MIPVKKSTCKNCGKPVVLLEFVDGTLWWVHKWNGRDFCRFGDMIWDQTDIDTKTAKPDY